MAFFSSMNIQLSIDDLLNRGLEGKQALNFISLFETLSKNCETVEQLWLELSSLLSKNTYPFPVHLYLFSLLYPHWKERPDTAPAWFPNKIDTKKTNLARFMALTNITNLSEFHSWTTDQFLSFWQKVVEKLKIVFKKNPSKLCDLSQGIENPVWFPSAKMNIVDSCFKASTEEIAVIYQNNEKKLIYCTYGALEKLTNRVANSLVKLGFKKKDVIGLIMPMTLEAMAIYLGIIKMGATVVSIADSFSNQEIALRLKIAGAKLVFTQNFTEWAGKHLALYDKVRAAHSSINVVLSESDQPFLQPKDLSWTDFLLTDSNFNSIACDPMQACHILFSSGTTGEPKAIPWNHTTPIKSASDAYFHQNIQPKDVLAWPTNLGWMMGPWLVYATLINQATLALYCDAPKDRAFGEFVQNAKVTMLGVVPTLVSTWRQSACMENLDWHCIKLFSSTGECSNPEDMLYLMSLAGYKPIIEYCGGTETGGGYVTSTLLQKNYPSLFSTAAMGINFAIVDEHGNPTDNGEVALIPPSIGLSVELLNADHHHIYYDGMPKTNGKILRRHGDQIKQLENRYYEMLGRIDDAMNLGGIKLSAIEIERVLTGLPLINEVAAIAISHQGPDKLIIFAVTSANLDKITVMKEMQQRINSQLNPLFKIHDVIFIKELPKTASNKTMRRVLRNQIKI